MAKTRTPSSLVIVSIWITGVRHDRVTTPRRKAMPASRSVLLLFVVAMVIADTIASNTTATTPIVVTTYNDDHLAVLPDNDVSYSVEAIHSIVSGWIITLDAVLPDNVTTYILEYPSRDICHVSRISETAIRMHIEIECDPTTDHDIPAFVLVVEDVLTRYGNVRVEETVIFHNRGTQRNPPWGVDRLDERELPLDGVYRYSHTGIQTEIFVVDTGIRTTHNQFEGRARNVFNAVTGQPDTRPNTDCHGHGTFVASIAAGVVTGTAKGARVVGVVSLDCNGRATTGMIATALSYIETYATTNPTRRIVVNLSFGGSFSSIINDHANALAALPNVVVVVAAGNEATNACTRSPASSPRVMTVGATDINDGLARFTNTGRCVNITAPGVQIRGADHSSDVLTTLGSGTSFSSPLVAGIVALTFDQAAQANMADKVMEVVYNWAQVRMFFPQTMAAENYDPWKSGIDYSVDVRDNPIQANAAYNYPFAYSRISFSGSPPHKNVDGNKPLYPPNTGNRTEDMATSLIILSISAILVWAL